MYTKDQLMGHLAAMRINPQGTLLVHSSMKAIGPVEGGADTVLDALCEYMQDGLLVFPTHTWSTINRDHNVFDVRNEPSCVGLLTNLFRVRPGVLRSWHPTHSVAACGKDAAAYIAGEEYSRTPCSRTGCWGKLYDRKAQILFIGCSTSHNTFLHGVEEWNHIPRRLAPQSLDFYALTPNGLKVYIPQHCHHAPVEPSQHYGKMEPVFVQEGAMYYGIFGDAKCAVGDAVRMAEITGECLRKNHYLFDDFQPVTYPVKE